MSTLHDFLVEHGKFPFPRPDELRSVGSTDIDVFEVGLLEIKWKAKHAVRDDSLAQKLCHTLKIILGNTPLAAGAENDLLLNFGRRLQFPENRAEDEEWITNPNEAHVSFSKNLFGSSSLG